MKYLQCKISVNSTENHVSKNIGDLYPPQIRNIIDGKHWTLSTDQPL